MRAPRAPVKCLPPTRSTLCWCRYPNPFEMVEMLRALYPDEPNIGGAMLDAAGNTIEPKEPDEYLLVESTKAQDELGLVRTTAPFFTCT